MTKMKKIIKYIRKPSNIILFLASKGCLKWMPDKPYLKMIYRLKMGKRLNLNNPVTFNEKLQWMKIYLFDESYTNMVDKYEVKSYVSDKIGEKYVIPSLGVWDKFEDIDFAILPDEFVLKCTHDSGGIIICKDKRCFNIEEARAKINSRLQREYFYWMRERPYKNVKPRILAEKYIKEGEKKSLTVYKVFNFGGEPKIIQVIQNDKQPDETIDYFDINWKRLDLRQGYPNSKILPGHPVNFEEMIHLAKELSQGFPFIRTDFYEVDGQIYFSEFTFYSDAGMSKFYPSEWDERLGKWIQLPKF